VETALEELARLQPHLTRAQRVSSLLFAPHLLEELRQPAARDASDEYYV